MGRSLNDREIRRGVRLGVCALGALSLSLCVLFAATAIPADAATTSVTVTFHYNGTSGADGTPQEWTVPPSVRSITADVSGAQGGDFLFNTGRSPGFPAAGLGGHVHAVLHVKAGEVLWINVAGAGGVLAAVPCGEGGTCFCSQPGSPVVSLGGYGGGGSGGGSGGTDACPGTGGGGASDIRSGAGALGDRLIVAGGGGGIANACYVSTPGPSEICADGGDGGGKSGNAGLPTDQLPGGGGTQTLGGSAAVSGSAGSFGIGGPGASTPAVEGNDPSGGGGGGGWYGGGGGGFGAPGASGGGGGSGHVVKSASQVRMTSGVNLGDGVVSISYQVKR